MADDPFPVRRLTPCWDCPFRRESTPGWTGQNPPEWYVDSAEADYTAYGLAPCHITQSDVTPLGKMACAGALIFARNTAKRPRDPDRQAAIDRVERDEATVFSNRREFIAHHRRPDGMRSWEDPPDA